LGETLPGTLKKRYVFAGFNRLPAHPSGEVKVEARQGVGKWRSEYVEEVFCDKFALEGIN